MLHFYLAGLTHAETAALLGISVGAVKTRLHKARRALHRQLSVEFQEDVMGEKQPADAGSTVEMRVRDVRRYRSPSSEDFVHVALLEEVGGTRVLPIWMGGFEATALALSLENAAPPRPLAYAFAAGLLQASGGRLREVRITRLQDEVFYAEAVIEGAAGISTVDARPSDALNLALLVDAPIQVEAEILAAPVPEAKWATGDSEDAAGLAADARAKWFPPRSDR